MQFLVLDFVKRIAIDQLEGNSFISQSETQVWNFLRFPERKIEFKIKISWRFVFALWKFCQQLCVGILIKVDWFVKISVHLKCSRCRFVLWPKATVEPFQGPLWLQDPSLTFGRSNGLDWTQQMVDWIMCLLQWVPWSYMSETLFGPLVSLWVCPSSKRLKLWSACRCIWAQNCWRRSTLIRLLLPFLFWFFKPS